MIELMLAIDPPEHQLEQGVTEGGEVKPNNNSERKDQQAEQPRCAPLARRRLTMFVSGDRF